MHTCTPLSGQIQCMLNKLCPSYFSPSSFFTTLAKICDAVWCQLRRSKAAAYLWVNVDTGLLELGHELGISLH